MSDVVRRNTRRLCAAVLVLLVAAEPGESSRAQQPPAATAEAQILALEAANNEAIFRGDAAALARMTSADFTFITPRGFLVDRNQVLAAVTRGEFEYRRVYDLKVRVYGDAAVVTGRAAYTVQDAGRDRSDAFRYTRLYVRAQGGWLAVAWQATREEELTRVY